MLFFQKIRGADSLPGYKRTSGGLSFLSLYRVTELLFQTTQVYATVYSYS